MTRLGLVVLACFTLAIGCGDDDDGDGDGGAGDDECTLTCSAGSDTPNVSYSCGEGSLDCEVWPGPTSSFMECAYDNGEEVNCTWSNSGGSCTAWGHGEGCNW